MSGDLGGLNSQDWQNLQHLAELLEEAWKKGGSVDLGQFLPPGGATNRMAILYELIKTDLECRWRHGQAVGLDYYLERFPDDLGSAVTLPSALIFEEYRVRQRFGDRPSLEHFQHRFPRQFDEVRRLVEEQSLATSAAPTPSPIVVPSVSLAPNTELPPTGCTLSKRIGIGATGEVWEAQAPGGVKKAIKIINRPIDPAEAQREIEAMELIKNLRHHFLLSVHAYWALQDRLIILMDLADGSLRDRMKQGKAEGQRALPPGDLLKYIGQAAEALDYLHLKKVQHRDIKPENILLTDDNVRVADFGLAKAQGTRRLITGTFSGTPPYMPPEAWDEKSHIHSDQYSLAATYFELRTGRRLYKNDSLRSLMHSHLYEKPNLAPLEQAEQQVLSQALAKNPDERFDTCLAFVHALEQAVMLEPPTPLDHAPSRTGPHDSTPSRGETGSQTIVPGGGASPKWNRQDTQPDHRAPGARHPQPPARLWRTMVVLALLSLVAVLGWIIIRPPSAKISLDPPTLRTMFAGETGVPVVLVLKRDNFSGPVRLTFDHDPDFILPPMAEIPQDKTSVEVELGVKDDGSEGTGTITINAEADGLPAAPLVLQVTKKHLQTLPQPAPAGVFRPAQASGIVTWKVGGKLKKYYDHIECAAGGHKVEFVLVPWKNKEIQPFYIMVDKVSNNLFAQFAESHPEQLPGSRWRLGARKEIGADWWFPDLYLYCLPTGPSTVHLHASLSAAHLNGALYTEFSYWLPHPGDVGVDGPANGNLPALRVDVTEASRFARWLGGALPSEDEWDTSAGRYEVVRGEGPYLSPWNKQPGEIAVDRAKLGPRPVGISDSDKSSLDTKSWASHDLLWTGSKNSYWTCRDMAGNGSEWTRTYRVSGSKYKEFDEQQDKIQEGTWFIYRGMSFAEPHPLKFKDIEEGMSLPVSGEEARGWNYQSMLPSFGFRVAIIKLGP